MGKLIIILGVVLVVIGLLYTYLPGAINWFGNLPGDIKVVKPNTRIYFPITSMIVVTILFNVILRVVRYFS